MAITLHRCNNMWVKVGGHPCWRVQKALDEAGIEYQLDKLPAAPWKRDETEQRTDQKKYPWIEFEDGSIYREESKEMAQRIADGKLDEAPDCRPANELHRPRGDRGLRRGPHDAARRSCSPSSPRRRRRRSTRRRC